MSSQKMSGNRPSAVGLDFGTSNSAATCVDAAGGAHLARFSGRSGVPGTFPSVLQFERVLENGVPVLRAYAGATAIERYLSPDSPGRLMRSRKAYLADRSFDGTSLYGRRLTLA